MLEDIHTTPRGSPSLHVWHRLISQYIEVTRNMNFLCACSRTLEIFKVEEADAHKTGKCQVSTLLKSACSVFDVGHSQGFTC